MLRLLAILLIAGAGRAAADLPSAWFVDYGHWPDGQSYTRTQARRDWPTLMRFDESGAARIRSFPAGSARRWLQVMFPHDSFGSAHGSKFTAELAPANSYTLEYAVHFPVGWEFNRNNSGTYGGGILPGLGGGTERAAGEASLDGARIRPMWRRDTHFSEQPQTYLEIDLDWRGQRDGAGDRFFAQTVEAGGTYVIKLHIDLGTPESDGHVNLWIDGTLRAERPIRSLGPGQRWKLNRYCHEAAYAGNDPAWAPAHDQWLLLGPVRVDTEEF